MQKCVTANWESYDLASTVLYYFHDPMCSWCWGYRPTWLKLQQKLPDRIEVRYVLGGLAADTDEPMPLKMQEQIQGYWRQIERELGTEFNFAFWQRCTPRRSTYIACRAVIAASVQRAEKEMIYAIQQAYYQRALNPSDADTLIQLACELGLDVDRFSIDLRSPDTEASLQKQIAFARSAPIRGFPSLVCEIDGGLYPINLDYKDYRTSLEHIKRMVSEYSAK